MSGREWKPGDVATIYCPDTYRRGLRGHDGWHTTDGFFIHEVVHRVEPLVVIDAEDREQVERLQKALDDEVTGYVSLTVVLAALREFANPKPPKPDEPQGLGAVVEDEDGDRWVRRDDSCPPVWVNAHGRTLATHWRCITAVRVLSEGVQP